MRMISFEMSDMPNAQSITNDQFQAIYAIALQDWSRNYTVTDAKETDGDWFLIVEKELDGDSMTQTFYRVEPDGDWGILYEVKREPAWKEAAMKNHRRLVLQAADLLSDEGENEEYDRAIIELTAAAIGIAPDEYEALAIVLRELKQ
jgi:hypothetical protein